VLPSGNSLPKCETGIPLCQSICSSEWHSAGREFHGGVRQEFHGGIVSRSTAAFRKAIQGHFIQIFNGLFFLMPSIKWRFLSIPNVLQIPGEKSHKNVVQSPNIAHAYGPFSGGDQQVLFLLHGTRVCDCS